MKRENFMHRKSERGVTMILVAISFVALLGMAALAIDVVSLYVARGEAQRAANAAALAGAKIFVSSGYTSAPSTWVDTTQICPATSGPGSTAAANRQAEAVAAENLIGGQPAQVQTINCDFTRGGNPQISVTVQRTGLPTFFARIWGRTANTVSATATAEAYNSSGKSVPMTVTSVKPWLVPNCDPTHSIPTNTKCTSGSFAYFVDPTDGTIKNNGSFIGKEYCFARVGRPGPAPYETSPLPADLKCPFPIIRFYGMNIPIDYTKASCPSSGSSAACSQVGSDDFISNIACTSNQPFSCTAHIAPGPPTLGPPLSVSVGVNAGTYGQPTRDGGRCLIHADAEDLGNGQDVFTASGPGIPVTIDGGTNNPNPSLQGVSNISRSSSVVTVPLYDGDPLCNSSGVCSGYDKTPQGFLELGITQTQGLPNHFRAVILNVTGCTPGASGTSIAGQNGSPIAVRLIQAP